MLRGAVAVDKGEGRFDRMISDFRTSAAILDFLASSKLAELASRGVSTPDLSIRIKTGPMALPAPDADKAGEYKAVIRQHVDKLRRRIPRLLRHQRRARTTSSAPCSTRCRA